MGEWRFIMKRISVLITVLVLIATMLPISLTANAAVTNVIYDFTFDTDSQGASGTYSDSLPTMVQTDYPNFVYNSGTLVYDTYAAVGSTPANTYVSGVVYPKNASNAPSYLRYSFRGSDGSPTVSDANNELYVHTYEVDLKFERAFALTQLTLRYGGSSWAGYSTIMNDAILFEVNNNGMLRSSGKDGKQLVLGQTYKVSAVVDVRGATRNVDLFLDGAYIHSGSTVVANESVKDDHDYYKKAIINAIMVRPYDGTTPNFTWREPKITIDNYKVTQGTDLAVPSSSVSIAGEDNFLKSPHNETTHTFVRAKHNNAAASFIYSIDPPVEGVGIEAATGKLFVSPDVSINTQFKVKAALASDTAIYNTKNITVKSSVYHDFENGNNSWDRSPVIATEGNGNKYLNLSSRSDSPDFGITSKVGKATVEFRTMGNASSGTISFSKAEKPAPTVEEPNKIDTGAWYFDLNQADKTGGNVTFRSQTNGTQNFITIAQNTWAYFKFVLDFDNGWCDVYTSSNPANGYDLVASQYRFSAVCSNFQFVKIHANAPIDDVRVYTGSANEIMAINKSLDYLMIPPVGKTANMTFAPADENITATWSLGDAYTDVSINSQTGVLTVGGNAAAGNISVKATSQSGTTTFNYPLKKFFYDFENGTVGNSPGTEWGAGTAVIAEETVGGNKYAAKVSGQSFNRYYMPESAINGRYIVEADIKTSANVNMGISIRDRKEWITASNLEAAKFSDFVNYQLIIDTNSKTYSAVIDGVLDPWQTNIPFNPDTAGYDDVNGPFLMAGLMCGGDMDNLAIYHPSYSAIPLITTPVIDEITEGSALSTTYKYFSYAGLEENCSAFEWFKCDTIDGQYTSLGASYTPAAADFGKYFKVTVTPQSEGLLVGTPVTSQPALFGGYITNAITVNGNGVNEGVNNFEEGVAKTLAANISYVNPENQNTTPTLYAVYYLEGKIVGMDVDYTEDVVKGGSADLTVSLSISVPAGKYAQKEVKLFMWDGVNLKPIFDEPIVIQ